MKLKTRLSLILCWFLATPALFAGMDSRVEGYAEAMQDLKPYFQKLLTRILADCFKELPQDAKGRIRTGNLMAKRELARWSFLPLSPEGQVHGKARHYYMNLEIGHTHYQKGKKHGVDELRFYVRNKGVYELRKQIRWNAGKIHGEKKLFHKNGRLMSVTRYEQGKRVGDSVSYDSNGRLMRKVPFVMNKRHGIAQEFWPLTGKLKKHIPYHEGKVHGTMKEYHDSGKVKKEVTLVKGKFHGIEKHYGEEGETALTRYWNRDKKVSPAAFAKLSGVALVKGE